MGKVVATNKRARHEYHVLETYEAGIELKGAEVKSVYNGHVSINEAFIRINNLEAFVCNMYIAPYEFNKVTDIDAYRNRRLLLHKKQIIKLAEGIAQKGFTIVPLKLYFNNSRAKLEIALARGKKFFDKRETIKKREIDRGLKRRLKNIR